MQFYCIVLTALQWFRCLYCTGLSAVHKTQPSSIKYDENSKPLNFFFFFLNANTFSRSGSRQMGFWYSNQNWLRKFTWIPASKPTLYGVKPAVDELDVENMWLSDVLVFVLSHLRLVPEKGSWVEIHLWSTVGWFSCDSSLQFYKDNKAISPTVLLFQTHYVHSSQRQQGGLCQSSFMNRMTDSSEAVHNQRFSCQLSFCIKYIQISHYN